MNGQESTLHFYISAIGGVSVLQTVRVNRADQTFSLGQLLEVLVEAKPLYSALLVEHARQFQNTPKMHAMDCFRFFWDKYSPLLDRC